MFFLPPRNGLELAGDALLEAIKILRQPEDVEEPIKAENRENMYLDQDRSDRGRRLDSIAFGGAVRLPHISRAPDHGLLMARY